MKNRERKIRPLKGDPLSSYLQRTMRKLAFHTTIPSHQRRGKNEDRQEAAHHHHLQVDQSHAAKEVQDVYIARTRNVDTITPLAVHPTRLLQADLYLGLLSILHLAKDFKSKLRKKNFSIVYQVIWLNTSTEIWIAFLLEKDLKENILKENPVPRNIDPVKFLGHSLAKIVEGRQKTLADKDHETVQSKIKDVLGQYACYGQ